MEYHTRETNIKRENREKERDGNTMAQGMGST